MGQGVPLAMADKNNIESEEPGIRVEMIDEETPGGGGAAWG